jgi:phosphoesterase RecJ-like protein
MTSINDISDALTSATNIAITAHIRPDGDAIGSCIGLSRMLKNAGKSPAVIDIEPVPDRYKFMIDEGECFDSENFDFSHIDCIIVLDSGSLDRAPEFITKWQSNIPIINIDHHLSNTKFGNLNFVDTKASSVGEILCRIASNTGLKINAHTAEALWVSIVTDTGRFSYSNTTPATMSAAAELLSTGINTADINHEIYNAMPLRQLKLRGRALERLTIHENGTVAMVTLSRNDFDELGCTPADTEDIVNLPRSLSGVAIALFLYEFPDTPETKISLRTAEPYDASEFCRKLGGGGHARAAGCALPGTVPAASEDILDRIHHYWFS